MLNVSLAAARVYAEALIDLAEDQGNLPQVVDDLHDVQQLFDTDETLRGFFLSHRFEREFKQRVVREAFEGRVGRPVLGLLHVLVGKQREAYLDNVVAEFERFRDLREGRLHVHVTTARPIADDQRDELRTRLQAATGKRIELHERVDPKLLGGLVMKVEDKVIDGSVKRRLERLHRALTSDGNQ